MKSKEETALPLHASPIKRRLKQKQLNWQLSCSKKSNTSALSLEETPGRAALWGLLTNKYNPHWVCCVLEPRASRRVTPGLYNHPSKRAFSQMEWRTACHFPHTDVLTENNLSFPAPLCFFALQKQTRLRGVDVQSAPRHIREGNNNNMEGNQSYSALPAVSSHLLLFPVQSAGPCLQAAPPRFWPERRGEE